MFNRSKKDLNLYTVYPKVFREVKPLHFVGQVAHFKGQVAHFKLESKFEPLLSITPEGCSKRQSMVCKINGRALGAAARQRSSTAWAGKTDKRKHRVFSSRDWLCGTAAAALQRSHCWAVLAAWKKCSHSWGTDSVWESKYFKSFVILGSDSSFFLCEKGISWISRGHVTDQSTRIAWLHLLIIHWSSDSNHKAQRLPRAELGNNLWHNVQSIATKVCCQNDCKWRAVSESLVDLHWQGHLWLSINIFSEICLWNYHPLCK